MSEPRTDRDVDQALAAWMDQVAPTRAPTRLLEGTFIETMKTRQGRVYPWNGIAIGEPARTAAGFGARLALVVIVALILVALAIAFGVGGQRKVVLLAGSPAPTLSPAPSPTASASSLPAPVSVTPEATIPVQGAMDIVARGAELWVLAPGRLDRIDPATNAVTATVKTGPPADLDLAFAGNAAGLWASDFDTPLVYRVDPATLKVTAKITAAVAPKGVLATAGGVWIADVHGGTVLRIDPATNKVVATIAVGPAANSGPNWLASGFGSIWVNVPTTQTIVRIDAVTNKVQATIYTPSGLVPCGGFAVGPAAIWMSSCESSLMARIDPATNTIVATVDMGGYAYVPTLINGVPWVPVDTSNASTGYLARVDPATNLVDRVLAPGTAFGGGGSLVVAAGSAWVTDGYNNAVLRLPLAAFAP